MTTERRDISREIWTKEDEGGGRSDKTRLDGLDLVDGHGEDDKGAGEARYDLRVSLSLSHSLT